MDARTRDLELRPDDAYRYASGGEVALPPLDASGQGTRLVRIDRPLDFAAVTDHAEWLGEVALCTEPESEVYGSQACRIYRGEERHWLARLLGLEGFISNLLGIAGRGGRVEEICDADGGRCRGAAKDAWAEVQAAAEAWHDRSSACRFTTFHAYEYSASPRRSKIHRNVIFRNERVPELPVSWIDAPALDDLWDAMSRLCNDADVGCEAIAIPHNPNLSNGRLLPLPDPELGAAERRARAERRVALEPVVEVTQVKGDSECRNGFDSVVGSPDELCGHEKIRDSRGDPPEDCGDGMGWGAMAGSGCTNRSDYARYALVEGLREEATVGVNPFAFGMIGSTDTHNATPGAVDEAGYLGSTGATEGTAARRLVIGEQAAITSSPIFRNPGGLAGIWAEENTRDALFDALRRREVFATTGPRIEPRLFGAWSWPAAVCERSDVVAQGYAGGVPMGGLLPPREDDSAAPAFLVSALRDPGSDARPGGLLQRIQIVKGWVGDDGLVHQAVHEVAGDASNGASVDPDSCAPRGAGADALCGVWRDPDFDADRAAVYYARVVENPSCRWSTWQCNALPAAERPPACSDPRVPKTIQERALTSPVWYRPAS